MNPELGQYRVEVLSAYVVTAIVLVLLVATVLYNSRKTARQLQLLRNDRDVDAG